MKLWNRLINSKYTASLRQFLSYGLYYPGHPHSPTPSKRNIKDIRYYNDYKGLDMRDQAQLELLKKLSQFYSDIPFKEQSDKDSAYYYKNAYFSYSDAIIMYAMLRHFTPKRIMELGSGYSSACILDSCKYANLKTEIHSFDLDFDRLDLLCSGDEIWKNIKRHKVDIRDIDSSEFLKLGVDDMLIIDSSHVSKYNSELHYLFFEILPLLKPGVLIHFHDVFDCFEYPAEWLKEGIFWNEQYLLRAFLQFNKAFEIVFFSDYMERRHTDWYKQNMPLCLKAHDRYVHGSKKGELIPDIHGQSLWIRSL